MSADEEEPALSSEAVADSATQLARLLQIASTSAAKAAAAKAEWEASQQAAVAAAAAALAAVQSSGTDAHAAHSALLAACQSLDGSAPAEALLAAICSSQLTAQRGEDNAEPATRQGVPLEARLYVTWRALLGPQGTPGPPLDDQALWEFFARFGEVAFCDTHGVRSPLPAQRARPQPAGAGYAFVGFAGAAGPASAATLLRQPNHSFRGAEIRVKVWRPQRLPSDVSPAGRSFIGSGPHWQRRRGGERRDSGGRGGRPEEGRESYEEAYAREAMAAMALHSPGGAHRGGYAMGQLQPGWEGAQPFYGRQAPAEASLWGGDGSSAQQDGASGPEHYAQGAPSGGGGFERSPRGSGGREEGAKQSGGPQMRWGGPPNAYG